MFFTGRGAGAPRGKVIWQKRARRWNWTIEKRRLEPDSMKA